MNYQIMIVKKSMIMNLLFLSVTITIALTSIALGVLSTTGHTGFQVLDQRSASNEPWVAFKCDSPYFKQKYFTAIQISMKVCYVLTFLTSMSGIISIFVVLGFTFRALQNKNKFYSKLDEGGAVEEEEIRTFGIDYFIPSQRQINGLFISISVSLLFSFVSSAKYHELLSAEDNFNCSLDFDQDEIKAIAIFQGLIFLSAILNLILFIILMFDIENRVKEAEKLGCDKSTLNYREIQLKKEITENKQKGYNFLEQGMTKEEQERRVTSWSEENMGIDLEEGKTNQIIETP